MPVAVNACVNPFAIEGLAGATAIDVSVVCAATLIDDIAMLVAVSPVGPEHTSVAV